MQKHLNSKDWESLSPSLEGARAQSIYAMLMKDYIAFSEYLYPNTNYILFKVTHLDKGL